MVGGSLEVVSAGDDVGDNEDGSDGVVMVAGDAVGSAVGAMEGVRVGCLVGTGVGGGVLVTNGPNVGMVVVGCGVGDWDGVAVGCAVGLVVGPREGGSVMGEPVGPRVVGAPVGPTDGDWLAVGPALVVGALVTQRVWKVLSNSSSVKQSSSTLSN